jgi:predicted TIM-barrel fold metal-dependent hydrolase
MAPSYYSVLLLRKDRQMSEAISHLISVDDHVIEPPSVWQDRVATKHKSAAPEWVREDDGTEAWIYEGRRFPITGALTVGKNSDKEWSQAPVTAADMNPSYYVPEARLKAMNEDGVLASLIFPTFPRFCGQTFLEGQDKELSAICVRAYNDWMIDEWCAVEPGRFIPLIILPLWDPPAAAAEIERCAAKGAKAVNFSENPTKLGLPSIHNRDNFWDPVFRATEESNLPLCIHIGSSSSMPTTSDDAPTLVPATLLSFTAQSTMTDWIFSEKFTTFPKLKLLLSEGGISWMPGTLHVARRKMERSGHNAVRKNLDEHSAGVQSLLGETTWQPRSMESVDFDPFEIFRNNIFGCQIADEYGWGAVDELGSKNVMIETDYPHSDTSYPHSLDIARKNLAGFSESVQQDIAYKNAERVFGLTPPEPASIPGFRS